VRHLLILVCNQEYIARYSLKAKESNKEKEDKDNKEDKNLATPNLKFVMPIKKEKLAS